MTIETLEYTLHNFVFEKYIEPELIVMHPATFEQISHEIYSQRSIICQHQPNFRGIPIFRSFDINPGEIKIS